MIRVDCRTVTIPLVLPDCTSEIISATLARAHRDSYALTAAIDPSNPKLVQLSDLPQDAPRGVYKLALQTNCGCFTAQVYVDCAAPAFAGTHYPTNPAGLIKACCEPDDGEETETPRSGAAERISQ